MFNSIALSEEEIKFFEKYLGQREERAHLLVSEGSGSSLVGLGGVIFRYGFLPSFFLVVAESQREKGIGQKLTREALAKWGHKPLFLTVPKSNAPAIHIYQKAGFRTIAPWRKINGQQMQLMVKLF